MSRLIAALLVACMGVVLSVAQDEKPRQPEPPPHGARIPFGPSGASVPFELIQQDGKTAWRVVGRGSVRIEELVAGLASACGMSISYSGKAAPAFRTSVPFQGPDAGVVIVNAELADFVSDLMGAAGVTLAGASTGRARVVTMPEAPSFALYVSEAELALLPRSEWVIVRAAPKFAGTRALDAIAELRARHNERLGVRIIDETGLVATGTVEDVRTLLRLVHDIDQAGAGHRGKLVKVFEVPQARAAEAASMINALFTEAGDSVENVESKVIIQTRRDTRVNAVAIPNSGRVIVRAAAGDLALVQTALDALK